MKASKEKSKFEPVTLTLETQEEFDMLYLITGYNSTIAETIKEKGYDTGFDKVECNRFIAALHTVLGELK